ncbi:DUF4232 domain-containing protein [Streptomyces axinellae]|uniref:DUF4232 domain-containing protein n=1 Tax=Streptomyces axinellae TaxID=552788 RepID=A0ABP6DD66_9ACTN
MSAKLNRAVRCTAAVLAVIAVGAGATACDSGSSSKAGASSSSKTGSHEAGSKEAGSKIKETAAKGSRTDAVNIASTSARATTAQSKRCHTGELRYTWGGPHGSAPDMEADHQQMATIKLTNSGGRTCTLKGFPGVRLISKSGVAWDLRRSSDTPSKITLKPGEDTAMASMNILPVPSAMEGAKRFKVSKVLLTPPDETTHVTLKWPYGGSLLDQSGATRPGTFVNIISVG